MRFLPTRLSTEPQLETAERDPRDDLREQQRQRIAMTSKAPELRRADLAFQQFGRVVHEPDGRIYRLDRGEQQEQRFATFAAWFVDAAGAVQFLEQPAGEPATLDEVAAKRAAHEQRRAEREAARPRWQART